MEYARGGELRQYVKKKGCLDEDEAREVFIQLIEAVEYCHQKGVIHRDLKLENILLEKEDQPRIRIVDFGISGLYQKGFKDKSQAGSLKYMAPEILNCTNFSAEPPIDVWSLGCILYELVYGKHPFNGTTKQIYDQILNQEVQFPIDNTDVSIECQNLIRSMLNKKPANRIIIPDIMESDWYLSFVVKKQKEPEIEQVDIVREVQTEVPYEYNRKLLDKQIFNEESYKMSTKWNETQQNYWKHNNIPSFLQPIGQTRKEKQQKDLIRKIIEVYNAGGEKLETDTSSNPPEHFKSIKHPPRGRVRINSSVESSQMMKTMNESDQKVMSSIKLASETEVRKKRGQTRCSIDSRLSQPSKQQVDSQHRNSLPQIIEKTCTKRKKSFLKDGLVTKKEDSYNEISPMKTQKLPSQSLQPQQLHQPAFHTKRKASINMKGEAQFRIKVTQINKKIEKNHLVDAVWSQIKDM